MVRNRIETPRASQKPGRPRSEAAREAILDAAFAELGARGYGDFAIEVVAARAGASKSTIYRWWPDRAALAVDSFFSRTRTELTFPELGSARADFEQQICQLGDLLRRPAGQALLTMALAGRSDRKLGKAFFSRWVLPRREWGLARLARAVAEGECRRSLDLEVALDLLYGPLYWRSLAGFGVPDEAWIRQAVALTFEGFGPRAD